MSRGRLKQSQYLLVGSGLLLFVLAGAAYRISEQHISSVESTLVSEGLIRTLDELLLDLDDAETGQRGYLLTGEARYLEPYTVATGKLDNELQGLAVAERSRPESKKERLETLVRLMYQKESELKLTVDLRQTRGLNEALAEVKTGRGMNYMNQIRQLIHAWKSEETSRFQQRLTRQRSRQVELEMVLALGLLLGVLFVLLSYRFSAIYERERNASEEEIRRLNLTLEKRVEERTAELTIQTLQLKHRSAELQRSNADLSQFAYVASHDLQEPLRMVGSYMGLLARRYQGKLDNTADVYIRYAINGASRMQALINDLLVYSQAGTQALTRKVISVEDILTDVMHNLQIAAEESGASVSWTAMPTLEADALKLTQVMQNLVGNAIKFRRPGEPPRIGIAAALQENEWLFSVRDNGTGFDPKYSDRIFQIFQRLHSVGKYAGTGMGLAICKRIIEHHGGRLWAESEPGAGSTFFFTLPAVQEASSKLEANSGGSGS